MSLTADQLTDIHNTIYEAFLNKGEVLAQNIKAKPLLAALDGASGTFAGGRDTVAFNIKAGQGGTRLAGYTNDDQLQHGTISGVKDVRYRWKEHYQGIMIPHTELKQIGIDVIEDGASQRTSPMSGREELALANLLEEKNDMMAEDYAVSLNDFLWGDGSTDAKAIAGIRSFILDNPAAGTTGGVSRAIYPWWRNRAATAAASAAGTGAAPIVSSSTGGGTLIQFLQKEERQRMLYRKTGSKTIRLCGSSFIGAYEDEIRANGSYSQSGFTGEQDGSVGTVKFRGIELQFDPTLDAMGYAKRCYTIDIGRNGIRLMYMDGQKMKRHKPARPVDRLVMYQGVSMTGVMIARSLSASGVYDIA